MTEDWVQAAARKIAAAVYEEDGDRDGDVVTVTPSVEVIADIIRKSMPEPSLLQCINCNNTESCAGAVARQHWHPGLCMHCGGAFRVVRA